MTLQFPNWQLFRGFGGVLNLETHDICTIMIYDICSICMYIYIFVLYVFVYILPRKFLMHKFADLKDVKVISNVMTFVF